MCNVCSRTFDTQNTHDLHFESVHEMKNVERCPHCKKTFRRLQEHLLVCNIDLNKRKKICQCGGSYTREREHKKHCTLNPLEMKPEKKKKPGLNKKKILRFQCSNCGKNFLNMTLMNRHIRKICKSATFSALQR